MNACRFRIVAAGAVAMCALGALLASPTTAARPVAEGVAAKITPPVIWTGPASEVKKRDTRLITDDRAWVQLWRDHRPSALEKRSYGHGAPAIDLEKWMAVAVFLGATYNADGVTIEAITEEPTRLLVRIRAWTYQTLDRADAVTPYGIFLLPSTAKEIVIEEDQRDLINAPPQWVEIGRFKAR